jgi:hypothetical protein
MAGPAPEAPEGFNNRLAQNWRLLLCIAEQIGGDWPSQLRMAARKLAPMADENISWSKRALWSFFDLQAAADNEGFLYSSKVEGLLIQDPMSEWNDYRGHRIKLREFAALLREYGIRSTKNTKDRLNGYYFDDATIQEAFRRFLGAEPRPDPSIRPSDEGKPSAAAVSDPKPNGRMDGTGSTKKQEKISRAKPAATNKTADRDLLMMKLLQEGKTQAEVAKQIGAKDSKSVANRLKDLKKSGRADNPNGQWKWVSGA